MQSFIAQIAASRYEAAMRFIYWLFIASVGVLLSDIQVAKAAPKSDLEALTLQVIRDEFHLAPTGEVASVKEFTQSIENNRDVLHITLEKPRIGQFRLVVNGPVGFQRTDQMMPIIFITSGFFAGTKPIELLRPNGPQIIIGFEYTPDPEQILFKPDQLVETLKDIPPRMYESFRWLQHQPWFHAQKTHLLAISFGGLYLPVTLRLLQQEGWSFASYIHGFSGGTIRTPVYGIARTRLGERDSNALADFVSLITLPYNPQIYLPNIQGAKLVIHASEDEVFLQNSHDEVNALIKGPKLTCVIDGHHIDLERTAEISLTLTILQQWVGSIENGSLPLVFSAPRIECVSSL